MNITSPILAGAAHIAEWPGDSVAALLKMVGTSTGLFDDSPDGGLGLAMSALAGVAAALAVAIALSVYFRSGYRSARDVMKHGLAATVVLGLLAFVAYDMRHAALAYLGINPSRPAVEFEIRLPKAALTTIADTQVELRTDRNQKLAQVQDALATTRWPQRAQGNGHAGLSHHRTNSRVEPARSGPVPVQAAAGGQPLAYGSVRAMASGRRRDGFEKRLCTGRAQRRFCDPLSRFLSVAARALASRFKRSFKQAIKQPSVKFRIASTTAARISSFRRRQIYNRRRKE